MPIPNLENTVIPAVSTPEVALTDRWLDYINIDATKRLAGAAKVTIISTPCKLSDDVYGIPNRYAIPNFFALSEVIPSAATAFMAICTAEVDLQVYCLATQTIKDAAIVTKASIATITLDADVANESLFVANTKAGRVNLINATLRDMPLDDPLRQGLEDDLVEAESTLEDDIAALEIAQGIFDETVGRLAAKKVEYKEMIDQIVSREELVKKI